MNAPIPYLLTLAALTILQAQQLQLDPNPPKLDCSKLDFLKERKPIFDAPTNSVRYGVALRKTTFDVGEPILADLWIDNQSEYETYGGGSGCGFPYTTVLFDESGHRLLSKQEQQDRENEKKGITSLRMCSDHVGGLITIPPHTCMAPADTHMVNLKLDYHLPPGVYYIYPGPSPTLYKQGIEIIIRKKP